MYAMSSYAAFVFALSVAVALKGVAAADVEPQEIENGPINIAVVVPDSVTLHCDATTSGSPRVQWIEYVTNPSGAFISDGEMLMPGHPNVGDYTLNYNASEGIYDLVISPTELADGGRYECRDTNAAVGPGRSRFAEFVTMSALPNCTDTLPSNGVVIEGDYHTQECQVFYQASDPSMAPFLYWTGPGTYQQLYQWDDKSAWAVVQYTVNKSMDGKYFTCTTNFTTDGFGGTDTATNAPDFYHEQDTKLHFVNYPPQNLYHTPDKPSYEIGDVLTCWADAKPLPTYTWTHLNDLVDYESQTFTITEDHVGNLRLRCQVVNSVGTANLWLNTTVNPITTPTTPTTTTTTTTTTAPPYGQCDDLTGRWEAERSETSTIVLCLNVDYSENGLLRGLLQNDTNEPYLIELVGRTKTDNFDEAALGGIWHSGLGASGYALECRRCYGEERMLLNLISRSSENAEFCDGFGTVIENNRTFEFTRKPITYPCSTLVSEMHANAAKANQRLHARIRP